MWFFNYCEYHFTLMSKLENSTGPLSHTHALIVLSPTSKLNSNSLTRDGHNLEPCNGVSAETATLPDRHSIIDN